MLKLGQIFSTEIVTGTCDGCKLNTVLVGINGEFFRCTNCGKDMNKSEKLTYKKYHRQGH